MKNGIGHGFFVTGTDTGIGKTYVSRLLCDAFAEQKRTTYMKPVQTGCVRAPDGILTSPDYDFVMQGRATLVAALDDHVPYRFEPACSPHLAASRAGVLISLEDIRKKYARIADKKSVTIVEGAGGVLAPLSESIAMVDLMLHLGLPVILVTSPRVGTLNHTFLTLQALESRGIEPAGVVINNVHQVQVNYIYRDTLRMVRERVPGTPLLEIGFKEEDCPIEAFIASYLDPARAFIKEIVG
jgi:dethiobiotin synthase